MEIDLNYFVFDMLWLGNVLCFWKGSDNILVKMELEFSFVDCVVYMCLNDGSYEFEECKIFGMWKVELLIGEVDGSFFFLVNCVGFGVVDVD